jgi:hypothetical protein
MRKFVLAAVLAAGVVFPTVSRAEVYEFGVNLPVEKQTVSDDVRGGAVTQYPFYPITPQRLSNTQGSAQVQPVKSNAYAGYGIHLSSNEAI